jgi:hypothetical protein
VRRWAGPPLRRRVELEHHSGIEACAASANCPLPPVTTKGSTPDEARDVMTTEVVLAAPRPRQTRLPSCWNPSWMTAAL